MGRDAYAFHDKRTVVFWSRKAGNTSLAEWVIRGLALRGEGRNPERRPRKVLKKAGDICCDASAALELIEKKGYEDFIIARNPFRRAVSAYVEKFVYYGSERLDTPENLKNFANNAYIEAMVMNGRTQTGGDNNYEGLSFVQFLEYVAAKVRRRRPPKEPKLNYHWNTQVPMAFDGRFTYKNILKLESISNDIRVLAEKLGWDAPFPLSRKNEPSARLENDADLSEVSSVELIKAGIVPGGNALLNARTKSLIREAYEIDFRMLGYDPENVGEEQRS